MSSARTSFAGRPSRGDAVLLLLAVAGLALFVWVLPRHRPDASAHYRLGEAKATENSAAFLAAHGFATDNLEARADLRRNLGLLDSLQATLGRPATRALLRHADAPLLPAYYWRIDYRVPSQPEGKDPEPGGDRDRFLLYLTLDGEVWSFEQRGFATPTHRYVDRTALRTALRTARVSADPTTPGPAATDLRAFPDSLLLARLRFDFEPVFGPPDTTHAIALPSRLATGGPVLLDATDAAALARHHLSRTALAGLPLRVDSTWVLAERGDRTALVRFVTSAPIHGQHARADVEISATGALQEMDVQYNPEAPSDSTVIELVSIAIKVGLYGLLVVVLLIAFFRRLMGRLIDVKTGLLDAAILGLLFGSFLALNLESFWNDSDDLGFGIQLLIGVVMTSVAAGLASLFFFFISSVTDSLARAVWAKKLFTTGLVRRGDFRNRLVGGALLRGVGLAGVLLGVGALALLLFPRVPLSLDTTMLSDRTFQPMLAMSFYAATSSYFAALVILLGFGTFLYRISGRGWVVMAGLAAVLGLTLFSPVAFAPGYPAWAVAFVAGGVVALGFWRFDLLTGFVALFLSRLVWLLSEGWLVDASPAWLDVGLSVLFVLTVLVLGFIGVLSGKSGREVAEYVPGYIEEMAGQERLKRELEIAHQVQESFLPRRMPQVEGLDVSGMCLPAQEVGGDYYDFIELAPGRLAICVGDVSGKGIHAAFYMTLTKGFLRTLCRIHDSPAEVLRRLNDLFCENAPKGIFISMIYGVVDVNTRTFTFARAGHNPIILKRSPSQQADLIQPPGLGIGLVTGDLFDDTIEERTLKMRTGDVLVFYTDGFSEAMNSTRDLYTDERLAEKVGGVGKRNASGILHAVSEDVHHFIESAGRHDDMTMVVVKLTAPSLPKNGGQATLGDRQAEPANPRTRSR